MFDAARLRAIAERLDEIPEVRDRILNAIAEEPPVNLADGGHHSLGLPRRLG